MYDSQANRNDNEVRFTAQVYIKSLFLCCLIVHMSQSKEGGEGKGCGEDQSEVCDSVRTIVVKSGIELNLSTLDTYFLGMWSCNGNKYRNPQFKRLQRYGTVKTESSFFVKSKSHSTTFS